MGCVLRVLEVHRHDALHPNPHWGSWKGFANSNQAMIAPSPVATGSILPCPAQTQTAKIFSQSFLKILPLPVLDSLVHDLSLSMSICKHSITVLNGRLSVTLVLGFAEDGGDDVVVLDEDLAFLVGLVGDEVDGFVFFSSVVALSTDTATESSAVDSPPAGSAISPPPKVIVVSAVDPDVIVREDD